ncbi:MAG TPA: hypothetical protein VKU86_09140 [Acidimicrobiales bacterium]|nr:hypothetical protein [Acidimicrobiales bacterium]
MEAPAGEEPVMTVAADGTTVATETTATYFQTLRMIHPSPFGEQGYANTIFGS